MFTFGSLFAGIGGIDLGLERAGMTCKWQVEIDPFCQKVLAKHWPDVERFEDVRRCGEHNLKRVNLVAGGFPCQDISFAGRGKGIKEDTRSGLWFEFYRIICELRPDYIFVENVSALLNRGIDIVLGDLAQGGYDAEWSSVSACSMGAPHMRKRVFIVAYSRSIRQSGQGQPINASNKTKDGKGQATNAFDGGIRSVWKTEPDVGRVAYGIPDRMDRLTALGNAVVPQVAEWIGWRILEADKTWC